MSYTCPTSEEIIKQRCSHTKCMWFSKTAENKACCILGEMRCEEIDYKAFLNLKGISKGSATQRKAEHKAEAIRKVLILDMFLQYLSGSDATVQVDDEEWEEILELMPILNNPFFLVKPREVYPYLLNNERKWKSFVQCNTLAKGYALHDVLGIDKRTLTRLNKEIVNETP